MMWLLLLVNFSLHFLHFFAKNSNFSSFFAKNEKCKNLTSIVGTMPYGNKSQFFPAQTLFMYIVDKDIDTFNLVICLNKAFLCGETCVENL